jgi:FemAB-related protein (PEP-CTERM system-associated)
VIESSFGQECHYLSAERDGQIVGVLPFVLVRSRMFGTRLVATGWGVAGATAVSESAAATAIDDAAEALLVSTKAEYIEYRDPANGHGGGSWIAKDGVYPSFEWPIEAAEDACLKQIPRKQRAVVRKALESGLTDRVDRDERAFYQLHALSMRNLSTPVFSRRYVRSLSETFGADCDIVTIYDGPRPLSSVLNFYFWDNVLPYYTGAHRQARRTGAVDLMYFRVMRRAVERGYRMFYFGRSKLNTGPYAFKKIGVSSRVV